mgnify:CR=1 FL=1
MSPPAKKSFPLRLDPVLHTALERVAAADFRSVNAEIEVLLREALARDGAAIEVLVQGSQPKRALLQRYGDGRDCVLVGSQSFWEGIDVPGDALQCELIDKLPFPPPNDPLVEARVKRLEAQGLLRSSLPEALADLRRSVELLRPHGLLLDAARMADASGVTFAIDRLAVPIAAPGAPPTGNVATTAMVIDAATRGIDPRVGPHVTLVMRDALAATDVPLTGLVAELRSPP